ncbi:serine/threonine-protein kinase pakD-like isoform X2 [Chrysoperla carnea]|uniref:serine/threonine-protein kinase pakD-like isoform X2 n=1 Tax=Chrysoperla carnea TaxID=189513 RepID=UPI001D07B473|nr:serine/threonine-protein kinase pakD-like isoform X2 [Chrysoperla carnea]
MTKTMKLVKLINLNNVNNNNIQNNKSIITLSIQLIIIVLLITCINKSSQTPIEYRRYCGEEIPKIIKIVCKGQYNGYSDDVPPPPPSIHGRDSATYYDNNNNNNYFTNRHFNIYNSYQSDDSQVSQQHSEMKIVDECCHKPCGWRTLRTYCDIRSNSDEDLRDEPIPENPPASITSTYHHPPLPKSIINYQNDSTPILVKKLNATQITTTPSSSSLSTNFDKKDKVRKKKKKKNHIKGRGRPCRCRKRKRRGHSHHQGSSSSTVFCVPCKKICRNVNKSPMRCQKV